MWCEHCQQDVPGLGCGEAGKYQCPRCGEVVCDRMSHEPPDGRSPGQASASESSAFPAAESVATFSLAEQPLVDTWELDESLRHAERMVCLDGKDELAEPRVRFDPAQPPAAGWHQGEPSRPWISSEGQPLPARRALGFAASLALWLGVAALTCGLILLGWAALAARDELQIVGLPITASGLLVLAAGLALRLEPARPSGAPSKSAGARAAAHDAHGRAASFCAHVPTSTPSRPMSAT